MAGLECLPHRVRSTNTLKGVVETAIGHVYEVSHQIFVLQRVHKIGHAKLLAQCLFVWIGVYANNARGAHQASALNHIEANTAKPKHSHRGTRLDLHGEGNGADARGDSAADVTDFVERGVFTNLRQCDFWQNREVGERRAAHVVQHGCAIQ